MLPTSKSVTMTIGEFFYLINVLSNAIYLRCNTIWTELSKSINKGGHTNNFYNITQEYIN